MRVWIYSPWLYNLEEIKMFSTFFTDEIAVKLQAFCKQSARKEMNGHPANFVATPMASLTFLLDHEDLIVDLLAKQDRMQIVEESLQMLRSVAEWNDYGDAMPGDAVRRPTSATRFHLHEWLLYLRHRWRWFTNNHWSNWERKMEKIEEEEIGRKLKKNNLHSYKNNIKVIEFKRKMIFTFNYIILKILNTLN